MAKDNTPQRVARLVRDYHAYNDAIEETRRKTADYAREKATTVARLRELMPAAEVAKVLGVEPVTVYKLLSQVASSLQPHNAPSDDTGSPYPGIVP